MIRARSTSTKIYLPSHHRPHPLLGYRQGLLRSIRMENYVRTFPSVTVLKESITASFVSISGVSSRNPITVCTIFVTDCLSCPCFFDSIWTCSFMFFHSPASLHNVTIATSIRDVDTISEAFNLHFFFFFSNLCQHFISQVELRNNSRDEESARKRTCLVCFSKPKSLSIAAERFVYAEENSC